MNELTMFKQIFKGLTFRVIWHITIWKLWRNCITQANCVQFCWEIYLATFLPQWGVQTMLKFQISPQNCKARAKRGWELMRVDSHESFRQLSSTIITSGQTRTKVRQTLIDSQEKFEYVQSCWECMRVDESAREFHAKREREFELSLTLILVRPGLKFTFIWAVKRKPTFILTLIYFFRDKGSWKVSCVVWS